MKTDNNNNNNNNNNNKYNNYKQITAMPSSKHKGYKE
jgi:hypothetical protein